MWKLNNLILLLLLILISDSCCTSTTINHNFTVNNDHKVTPEQIYSIIKEFDSEKEYNNMKIGKSYDVGIKLDSLFENLNPNLIINDTNYRKPILFFLEKKFISLVHNTGNKNLEYVSNASNWGGDMGYLQYSLNIFSRIKSKNVYKYSDYNSILNDVVCINEIIKECSMYLISNEGHISIHSECMKLMPIICSN